MPEDLRDGDVALWSERRPEALRRHADRHPDAGWTGRA
jgi:hypothetical protein